MITKGTGPTRRAYQAAPMPDALKDKVRSRFGDFLQGLPYVTWDVIDETAPSYVGIAILGTPPNESANPKQADWFKYHLDFESSAVSYETYFWGNGIGANAELEAIAPKLAPYQTSIKRTLSGSVIEYTYYYGVTPAYPEEAHIQYAALLAHFGIERAETHYGLGIKLIDDELIAEEYYDVAS